MAVHFNKTCTECGHNWYPGPKDPAKVCPACGGTSLVSYAEAGKGGGSSFIGKSSATATPMLIGGVIVALAIMFFWYTENLAPEKNPFREQFDRHLYGKNPDELDYGGDDSTSTSSAGGDAPLDPGPGTSSGSASGGDRPSSGGDVAPGSGKGSAKKPKPLPPVGDDRLHLKDGRTLQGKLIGESDETVAFRYRNEAGKVEMKVFKRELVDRVERGKE